jgi:hypothetical protein
MHFLYRQQLPQPGTSALYRAKLCIAANACVQKLARVSRCELRTNTSGASFFIEACCCDQVRSPSEPALSVSCPDIGRHPGKPPLQVAV